MREPIEFGGLYNAFHESKVPKGRAWAMQNCTVGKGILQGSPRYTLFGARTSASASDVCYGIGYGKASTNEVQRLQLSYSTAPTSGDVDLVFDGQQTATALAYNATATDVLNSLEALSNIAIGDVKVTGGPWPGAPIDVEFMGGYANTDVALMTSASNTLNNSATLTPVERRKGGSAEVYLVAIKNDGDSTVTMYSVDTSGVYTSIATGLTASNWFFQQYGDRIFAVNATDGLNFYRLGGSWNDGSATAKPKAPVIGPNFLPTDYDFSAPPVIFNSGWASIAQSGLGGAPTVTGGVTTIELLSDTALTSATEITVTATYTAAQDQMFKDIYRVSVFSESVSDVNFLTGSVKFRIINADGSPVTIEPVATMHRYGDGGVYTTGYFHFANSSRTSRDNILKYEIKFTVSSWGTAKKAWIQIFRGNSWMASYVPFEFGSGESDITPTPERKRIRYAYAYYNATTGVLSNLSEVGTTENMPPGWPGVTVAVRCRGSSDLTTSDRIYVVREESRTGQWRILPVDPNNLGTYGVANVTSGNATYTDKWMEEELKDFPIFGQTSFGNTRTSSAGSVIGVWKQSLVLGSNRKLWESFVGFLPSESPVFAPDPDDRNATIAYIEQNVDNADRGRTMYLSDDRSEEVYAVLGQDSLYGVGPTTSYASVGDTPAESSVCRRLPGSRGAVGFRAAHRFGGGIQVGSEDGLWYYSVGRGFSGEDNGALVEREETIEVRKSYMTTLLGTSYSGLEICEYRDDVWVANGTKYLKRSRDGQWEEGTFADSVLAFIPVRSYELRFASSTGKMFEIDPDTQTDNGTTVNWTYETGIMDGPSTRITDIELQVKGQPTVTVRVYRIDGAEADTTAGRYDEYVFDTVESQVPYRRPMKVPAGMRYKLIFSGQAGRDEVHTAAIEYEPRGKPLHG